MSANSPSKCKVFAIVEHLQRPAEIVTFSRAREAIWSLGSILPPSLGRTQVSAQAMTMDIAVDAGVTCDRQLQNAAGALDPPGAPHPTTAVTWPHATFAVANRRLGDGFRSVRRSLRAEAAHIAALPRRGQQHVGGAMTIGSRNSTVTCLKINRNARWKVRRISCAATANWGREGSRVVDQDTRYTRQSRHRSAAAHGLDNALGVRQPFVLATRWNPVSAPDHSSQPARSQRARGYAKH